MNDENPTREHRRDGELLADDRPSFVSLSGDFYRGEVHRAVTWRRRLDQTTHWAVIVIAALLTWVFSSQDRPHYILLLGMFLLVTFLLIEANRYREFDLWRGRVRFLQEHLIAEMYAPRGDDQSWREELGTALRNPSFTLGFWQAAAHRLRRVYLALSVVLLVAWVVRITVFVTDVPWYGAAAVPGIPGRVVVAGVGLFYLVLVGVVLWSHQTTPREFRE